MTNEEQIYISAVRYALGRMTYIVSVTVKFIMTKDLSSQCKLIMSRDISEAMSRNEYGQECDRLDWDDLQRYLLK